MVEVCEERLNAVVDIRSWRAVELGLALRLLMPLGRIGRGGCRRVGAWLKSGCVVVGLVLALPTVAVPCVDADERKHGG